jgi:hypothetical protein
MKLRDPVRNEVLDINSARKCYFSFSVPFGEG